MQKTIRPLWFCSAVLTAIALAVLAVALFANPARANPSSFTAAQSTTCSSISTSTAAVYMTPGTATTTYTFDTGCASAGSMDSAAFLVQLAGSSTLSSLGIDIQYSQDNIDWYATSNGWNAYLVSTTSANIGNVTQYLFPFASSTITRGAVTNANGATSTRTFIVPTPTRYTRAVLSITGANGAVWGEFVGKRQNP